MSGGSSTEGGNDGAHAVSFFLPFHLTLRPVVVVRRLPFRLREARQAHEQTDGFSLISSSLENG